MKSALLASALLAGITWSPASARPLCVERALVTEVVYVTKTIVNVFVYVDENGEPISTTTMENAAEVATLTSLSSATSGLFEPAPQSLPVSQPYSLSVILALVTSSVMPDTLSFAQVTSLAITTIVETMNMDVEQPSYAPSSSPSASTTSQNPASTTQLPSASNASPAAYSSPFPQNDSEDRLGIGITYDPFGGTEDSPRCKTEQEITSDFEKMKDYSIIRIYGMGCNIIPVAMENIVKYGQKLMAGAYLSNESNGEDLSQVIQTLQDAINGYAAGNWDIVQLFSVENEQVNDHDMTVSAVIDAINSARNQLRGLGFNGPVGAVETVPVIIDNPAICEASDVVMVNCHAFFDPNTVAENAGTFVKSEMERVETACNSKRVVVTESGWPRQGNSNGEAVPSSENQRKALASIRDNFDHDMFLHHAFDATWKGDDASTFNTERFWGVLG